MLWSIQSRFDYSAALQIHMLHKRERALGPEHPDVATFAECLGRMSVFENNPGHALPHYQSTLDIRERTLGADDPDVVRLRGVVQSLRLAAGREI
jgi:hypothetical protein